MDNKQIVRRKCQEANPKLMELSFGCEVRQGQDIYLILSSNAIYKNESYLVRRKDTGAVHDSSLLGANWHILGHEPTLADVLLAIGVEKNIYCSAWTGLFSIWSRNTGSGEMVSQHISWNLSLSFSEQSDATFEFLAKFFK